MRFFRPPAIDLRENGCCTQLQNFSQQNRRRPEKSHQNVLKNRKCERALNVVDSVCCMGSKPHVNEIWSSKNSELRSIKSFK